MRLILALAALLLSSSLLCSSLYAAVKAENAWIRLLPPNVKTTAAYMILSSDRDDRLISASTPLANNVEVHKSSMHDGMMSMDHVETLEIPANQPMELKPQGYHLMVMGLKQTLKAGQEVTFNLLFEQAGDVTVKAVVESR